MINQSEKMAINDLIAKVKIYQNYKCIIIDYCQKDNNHFWLLELRSLAISAITNRTVIRYQIARLNNDRETSPIETSTLFKNLYSAKYAFNSIITDLRKY
jgi:hypothetical protein